ncbi:caspase, EACC1-associated type [Streptomyces sp. 4N509B]|uniref:caspase, EACC1-associated type n=1 Tax=Streptomyces sp. 4N509B TaxID=3457413 RepID=UPI003FCFE162
MAFTSPPPFFPVPEETQVLLIGVSRYAHHPELRSVVANVTQLEKALTDGNQGRLPTTVVRPLLDPEHDEVFPAVQRAAREAKDLLLCYFAGHGHLDPNAPDELYLLPRNAHGTDPTSHAIKYTLLRDELATSDARHVVLILDCCYSGSARPPKGGGTFTLITSSREQRPQDSGDGTNPTPFTAALLTVLREGVSPNVMVTVNRLAAPLKRLAAKDAEQAERADSGYAPVGDWDPNVVTVNGPGDTVVSHVLKRPGRSFGEGVRQFAERQRRRVTRLHPLRTLLDGTAPLTRRCSALALLLTPLATACWLLSTWWGTPPPTQCGIPLQLRVVTTPEYEEPLAQIMAEFEQALWPTADDDERDLGIRPSGCPQVDAYVFSSSGSAVTGALANSASWADPKECPTGAVPGPGTGADPGTETGAESESGTEAEATAPVDCLRPLYDIGPLPDVWFAPTPASAGLLTDEMATSQAEAWLGKPQVVARSPAVLAVPGDLGAVAEETGTSLQELLDATEQEGLTVRRADPASSAASLAFGVAAERTGAPLVDTSVPLPLDDDTLLCGLADASPTGGSVGAEGQGGEDEWPALLLAERSVVSLVDRQHAAACLTADVDVDDADYTAYYPDDVAPLDLSLVPVFWDGGDQDETERRAAIAELADWLREEEGRFHLERHGFRAPDGSVSSEAEVGGEVPLRNGAFSVEGVRTGDPLTARDADAYLTRPAAERRPLDVVFVIDLSSSSYAGNRVRLTDSALGEAVTALSDESPGEEHGQPDRYAVLTAPGDAGGGIGDPLGALHAHGVEAVEETINGFSALPTNAPVEEAVEEGLRLLGDSEANGYAPVLVLITDDEDSEAQPRRSIAPQVPIVLVTFGASGCDSTFNEELIKQEDLCVDSSLNQVAALRGTFTDQWGS